MQGTVVDDRYEILSHLGGGGMAQVWLAADRKSGSKVAVKILSSDHAHKKRSVERFRREAQLLRTLQHPNLVRGLDGGQIDGRPYIVMEYIDGPSIDDLIKKRGHLSPDEALKLLLDIALGLDQLFVRGSIQAHRDIKPMNILVTTGGTAKITDFGIAKAVSEDESMTMTSSFLGSPHYMSPEQITDPRSADVRSDLYALGTVFYEMLTGEKAYPGKSHKEVLDAHFELDTPHVRDDSPLGAISNRILDRTLAIDVIDRYQTPRELIEDLAPAVGADVAISVPRFSRNATQIAIGVAAVIVVATLAIGMTVASSNASASSRAKKPDVAAPAKVPATTASAIPSTTPAPASQKPAEPIEEPPPVVRLNPQGSKGGVSVGGGAQPMDTNKAVIDATKPK